MKDILTALGSSPALAGLGALVIVAIVVIPLALRVAGLSGAQIVALLTNVAKVAIGLVRAFRCQDDTTPPQNLL